MSNMRVLSVGTQVQRDANGQPIQAPTATLEVTPEEAERLAIAMNQGAIALVLRGFGDPDSVQTGGAVAQDVLSQLRGASTARTQPAARTTARRPAPRRTPPAPVVQALPPAPPKPDSLTVRIWRGDKVTQQKFELSDSTRGTPRR
jgi:pilus assembly protein CpaB